MYFINKIPRLLIITIIGATSLIFGQTEGRYNPAGNQVAGVYFELGYGHPYYRHNRYFRPGYRYYYGPRYRYYRYYEPHRYYYRNRYFRPFHRYDYRYHKPYHRYHYRHHGHHKGRRDD